MKRFIYILFFLVFSLSVHSQNNESLCFLQDVMKLGEISTNKEIIEVSFKYVNRAAKNIAISKVLPSCGCMTPDYPHDIIRPNATGRIKIKLKVSALHGFFRKSILVYTSDGKRNMLIITGKYK